MAADENPMPDPAADWDVFMLTTCYAAGRCQGDLFCPRRAGCHRLPGEDGDDDYDG